jgi:carbonic anhydrase/acetyltransferase-like protein (isoleucine patch superfamily)
MALIKAVKGVLPQIAEDVFMAENATIVGDVVIESGSSIWFNAVVRGDVNKIRIGKDVNIQDGAVIHCTYEKTETHIGDRVSIGHNAIVHGCTIQPEVLIGMGAIVLDNVLVESHVLVAAGAVVLENSHLESGYIYAGVPAKKVKKLDPDQFHFSITRTADNYKEYASWFDVKNDPEK